MIISLAEANNIDSNVTQDDLDAIEIEIRTKTNNKFQNTRIRYKNITFIDDKTIGLPSKVIGLKVDDTIEINYSGYNDGLYLVKSIAGDVLTFDDDSFTEIDLEGAMLTKVEYPADIKRGVKNILRYEKKMNSKVGIKSESISRMKITYKDTKEEGLYDFLQDYMKMRW